MDMTVYKRKAKTIAGINSQRAVPPVTSSTGEPLSMQQAISIEFSAVPFTSQNVTAMIKGLQLGQSYTSNYLLATYKCL
jgi:biotin transporter BioY